MQLKGILRLFLQKVCCTVLTDGRNWLHPGMKLILPQGVSMGRAIKSAVSMPEEEFKKLGVIRLKEGVNRSKVILEAFKLLKKSRMMEEQIRRYEEGYRNMPERPHNIIRLSG